MLELARFTDRARGMVKTTFRRHPTAPERDVVAAMSRGLGGHLLAKAGIVVDALSPDSRLIERRALIARAVTEARRRGDDHVGTEHLLLALARIPGSSLAACGASAEWLDEFLSAAQAEWSRSHPPLGRRLGMWCRSVLRRITGK
jgi:hypothetical protein